MPISTPFVFLLKIRVQLVDRKNGKHDFPPSTVPSVPSVPPKLLGERATNRTFSFQCTSSHPHPFPYSHTSGCLPDLPTCKVACLKKQKPLETNTHLTQKVRNTHQVQRHKPKNNFIILVHVMFDFNKETGKSRQLQTRVLAKNRIFYSPPEESIEPPSPPMVPRWLTKKPKELMHDLGEGLRLHHLGKLKIDFLGGNIFQLQLDHGFPQIFMTRK